MQEQVCIYKRSEQDPTYTVFYDLFYKRGIFLVQHLGPSTNGASWLQMASAIVFWRTVVKRTHVEPLGIYVYIYTYIYF